MADPLDSLTGWAGSFSGVFGSFWTALKHFIPLLLFAVIMYAVYWLMKYKHQITVRKLTGGKKIIVRDRAREIYDKKRVKKLKLMKLRETISLPPDEACEVTSRGKIHADVYRTNEGQYIWVVDRGLKGKIVDIPDGSSIDEFQPLNTMDRDFYASEWEEAEKYGQNTIWQNLPQIAGLMFILIMFVLVIVYWGDIAKPAMDSQKMSIEAQKLNNEMLDKIAIVQAQQKGEQVITDNEQIPPNS